MNDQEPWEEEKVKNPWLIETEEDKKIVQREGKLIKEEESDFFRGNEKIEKRKIAEIIKRGSSGWNDSDSKELLLIFEDLTKGRTHLNKDDIKRIINSLERGIAWKSGKEEKIIRKLISKLKELI
ncbi:MAG: hypothetical protein WC446_00235 [Candidatus Paceibacterota bacterium]|jgi:hypothetical protein